MPATTKGGHQDAWRPAPPLTVNAVLHVFWSEVEGGLGVAVGEVGVGPVTQEERADLPAALGGSLVHGRELPEVSSVDLCTVLEEGRARWGEGKVGGQDGGKKEEPSQRCQGRKDKVALTIASLPVMCTASCYTPSPSPSPSYMHTPHSPTHSPSPLSPHLQQHLHHLVVAVGASVVQGDQATASMAPENSQRPTIATQPSPPSWRCHNQTLGEGLHEFDAHPLSLACTSPPYLRRDLTMLTRLNPAARWSGEDCRHTDAHTVCLCVRVCACLCVCL